MDNLDGHLRQKRHEGYYRRIPKVTAPLKVMTPLKYRTFFAFLLNPKSQVVRYVLSGELNNIIYSGVT